MSSYIRRIQKNIAKAQGFRRFPSQYITTDTGLRIPDPRSGKIVDSNDSVVGDHWPKVSAPTRKV